MIFEQNYERIYEHTLETFRGYARRSFVYAVIAMLEKKKLSQNRLSVGTEIDLKDDMQASINSFEEGGEQLSIEQHDMKKKTMKSIIFKEPMLPHDGGMGKNCDTEELEVSQVYYGDRVMLMRGGTGSLESRIVVYNSLRLLKGQRLQHLKIRNTNIEKCLFEVVDPQQRTRKALEFGDAFALKNLQDGKYLRVNTDKLADKCFGCESRLNDIKDESCVFKVGRAYSKDNHKGALSNLVFTKSQLRIVLAKNPFYKLLIRIDDKMAQDEQTTSQLIGSCNSEDLQLVKLRADLHADPPVLQTSLFYSLKTQDGQFLATVPAKKVTVGAKEKVFSIFIENEVKCIFCIDEVALCFGRGCPEVCYHEQKSLAANSLLPNGCWSVVKSSYIDSTAIYDDDNVLLINRLTQQYLSYNPNNKKYNLTPDRTEAAQFTVEEDERTKVCNLRLVENNCLEHLRFREDSIRTPTYRSEHPAQESAKSFIVQRFSAENEPFLKLFGDVLEELVAIYQRIGFWGLVRDDKNEQHYLYRNALSQEYLLKAELMRYEECVLLINNYINGQQPKSTSLSESQSFLKQIGILDILIYFCRLATSKMDPNIKGDRPLPSGNTAFTLAKRHLEPMLLRTIALLFKMIKDNRQCSDVLIQYASFFNQMLVSYPQQAGGLLQEAIRNLSILHTSYTEGEELFQWIKLVDYPSTTNLPTQIKYLQILAEVMVDPSDNGITNYQNRCHQQLFSQRIKFKTRNLLLSFELLAGIPHVVAHSQSLSESSELADFVVAGKEARCSINLQKLLNESQHQPLVKQLIDYILTIVRLLRNMCKDRNKKLTKFIEGLGLDRQYVAAVVRSPLIDSTTKLVFLDIYFEMYVNQDPFIPFRKIQSKCFFFDQLSKCDINAKLCSIFRQYSQPIDVARATVDLDEYIVPFVQAALEEVSGMLAQPTNHTQQAYALLLALIKFVYNMSNLGFLRVQFLRTTLEQLIGAASRVLTTRSNETLFERYGQSIVLEMVRLIDQVMNIIRGLLVIQTLSLFHRRYVYYADQLTEEKRFAECHKMVMTTLEIKSFNRGGEAIRSKRSLSYDRMNNQKPRKTELTVFPAEVFQSVTSLEPSNNFAENPYAKLETKCSEFLLRVVLSCRLPAKSAAFASTIELLKRKCTINRQFGELLSNVEVIVGRRDQLIFNELTSILNIYKLELQCNKLIDEFAEFTGEKVRREIILEINSLLKKLTKKLDLYCAEGTESLRKAQRILANLCVYNILKVLVQKSQHNNEFKEVMCTFHRFLLGFCRDNEQNKRLVAQEFCMFARNDQSVWLAELLVQLFQYTVSKEQAFRELLEISSWSVSGELVFEVVNTILMGDNPTLNATCCNHILHNPVNQRYFTMPVSPTNKWFYRVLSRLLRNSPEIRECVSKVFPRKELEHKLSESSYSQRITYLELCYSLYYCGAVTDFQKIGFLNRLVVPELKAAARHLDGLVSESYLLELTSSAAKDDEYLEIERRTELFSTGKQAMQSLRYNPICSLLIDKKGRKPIEPAAPSLDEQTKYWHFLSSINSSGFSLFELLREIFEENNGLVIEELKPRFQNIRDNLALLVEISEINEYRCHVDQADYILTLMDTEFQEAIEFKKDKLMECFTAISSALTKAKISVHELLELFNLRRNFMELLTEGNPNNRWKEELPAKEFIKRFEKLRKRLVRFETIKPEDFRMFYNLFSQEKRNITQIFVQKVIELQEHKKSSNLNGLFIEMRGQFFNDDPEETAMQLIREITKELSQDLQDRKEIDYTPSRLLEQKATNRYLGQFINCLNEHCGELRKEALLKQFQSIVKETITETSPTVVLENLGVTLTEFGYNGLIAELFVSAIKTCKGTASELQICPKKLQLNLLASTSSNFFEDALAALRLGGSLNEVLHESVKISNVLNFQQIIEEVGVHIQREIKRPELDMKLLRKVEVMLMSGGAIQNLFNPGYHNALKSIGLTILLATCSASDQNFIGLCRVTKILLQRIANDEDQIGMLFNHPNIKQLVVRICSLVHTDLYTSEECLSPINQLFGGLLELLIKYYSKTEEVLCNNALLGIDFAFLKGILEVNYTDHYEQRVGEIERQDYCNHEKCDTKICQKGKLKVYDDLMLGLLCKIMIFIEISWRGADRNLKKILRPADYQVIEEFMRNKKLRDLNEAALKTQQYLTEDKQELSRWRQIMKFYLKISGKIQIIQDGRKKEIFFKVPFIRAYRNNSVKEAITDLLLDVEPDHLHTQLHHISTTMHEQLLAHKMYSMFLPKWFLDRRESIELGLTLLMFLLNLLVCFAVTSDSSFLTVGHVCRLFILMLAIPHALYTFISTNTVRRTIRNNPKLTFGSKLVQLFGYRQIGLVLQVLSLYYLVLYPVSCLFLSMNIRSLKKIVDAIIKVLPMTLRLANFMIVLLIAAILLLNIQHQSSYPVDQLGEGLMEMVVVVFEQTPLKQDSLLGRMCRFFPVVLCLRLIMLLGSAIYIVTSISQAASSNDRYRRYRSTCVICLKKFEALDQKDMKVHIKGSHNVWNYLDYFIYLRERKTLSMSETMISGWIEEGNWSFLMIR